MARVRPRDLAALTNRRLAVSHPNSTDRILIVEDDKKTAGLISMYLEKDGFKTWVAHDGEQALALAKRYNPTFVILDLMLPKIDGWEVCRRLRSSSDVPILILTARDEEMERVLGLSLGADDYVVKPFSPRELVARVKAILRRTGWEPLKSKNHLSHKGLILDPEKCKVTLNGRPISSDGHTWKGFSASGPFGSSLSRRRGRGRSGRRCPHRETQGKD
jgi:DNA-binding response OmpR family regulator